MLFDEAFDGFIHTRLFLVYVFLLKPSRDFFLTLPAAREYYGDGSSSTSVLIDTITYTRDFFASLHFQIFEIFFFSIFFGPISRDFGKLNIFRIGLHDDDSETRREMVRVILRL